MPDTHVGDFRINNILRDRATGEFVMLTNSVCTLPHDSPEAYRAFHADGCHFAPCEGLVFVGISKTLFQIVHDIRDHVLVSSRFARIHFDKPTPRGRDATRSCKRVSSASRFCHCPSASVHRIRRTGPIPRANIWASGHMQSNRSFASARHVALARLPIIRRRQYAAQVLRRVPKPLPPAKCAPWSRLGRSSPFCPKQEFPDIAPAEPFHELLANRTRTLALHRAIVRTSSPRAKPPATPLPEWITLHSQNGLARQVGPFWCAEVGPFWRAVKPTSFRINACAS